MTATIKCKRNTASVIGETTFAGARLLLATLTVMACTTGVARALAPSQPSLCSDSPTTTTFSVTPSVALPDNTTVTSTITVPDIDDHLWDLDVRTFISTIQGGDLDMTLTSPLGTVVTLTTDNGGSIGLIGITGTLWDDDATQPVTQIPSPFAAPEDPLVPEEALGAFIGEDPQGVWTLSVTHDRALGPVGLLTSWELHVTTLPPTSVPETRMTTYTSSPGTSIPDPGVVTDTIVVSEASATRFICDVNITTFVPHGRMNDVHLRLTSPSGTAVSLVEGQGPSVANVFNGTVWDDDATDGSAPDSGPVTDATVVNNVVETPLAPEAALASLIGEEANGTWTLRVEDDSANALVGALASWSLDIELCSCSTCNDGSTEGVEVCDVGAASCENGDGDCLCDCSGFMVCGDGTVNGVEFCDDGFTDACGTCNVDCGGVGSGATCGDASWCPELEGCDDGVLNGTAGSCCDALCQPEPSGAVCDDGLFCNGEDTCDGAGTCAHAGDPCLANPDCQRLCNEGPDTCLDPLDQPCGDPNTTDCTDPDTCDGMGTCLGNHQAAGLSCTPDVVDHNICTQDGFGDPNRGSCDGAGFCDQVPPAGCDTDGDGEDDLSDPCTLFAFTSPPLAIPDQNPNKAKIIFRKLEDPVKQVLRIRGQFNPAFFTPRIDPSVEGAYLKVVDSAGDLMEVDVPGGAGCVAGDGWRKSGSSGKETWTYKNVSGAVPPGCLAGSAMGLQRIRINDRTLKKGFYKYSVKAKGASLFSRPPMYPVTDLVADLSLGAEKSPGIAGAAALNGQCLESIFTGAPVAMRGTPPSCKGETRGATLLRVKCRGVVTR